MNNEILVVFQCEKLFVYLTTWFNFEAPVWKLHNPYCLNQEAEKAGDKAEKDRLSTRVRFHLSHKFGDEKKIDDIPSRIGRCHRRSIVISIYPLFEVSLSGGNWHIQENPIGQQRISGTQCICSPLLLQTWLLRCLARSFSCLFTTFPRFGNSNQFEGMINYRFLTTETNLKTLYIFCCLFTASSVELFVVNVKIFVYSCVFQKKEKQHSQNMKAHSKTHFENKTFFGKWKVINLFLKFKGPLEPQ